MQILFNTLISSVADQLHQMGEVPWTNRQALTPAGRRRSVCVCVCEQSDLQMYSVCYWTRVLAHVNWINPGSVLTVPDLINLRSAIL